MSSLSLWTLDETVLALHLAMTCNGARPHSTDPRVCSLSKFLRDNGPGAQDARFRNSHGVARKVGHFVDKSVGLAVRADSALETSVWLKFSENWQRLDEAARIARAAIMMGAGGDLSPSRGPVPRTEAIFCAAPSDTAYVYLACLESYRTFDGEALLKVGHSGDPNRRTAELNAGFPAVLPLRWRMIAIWPLPDRLQAYRCEQALLALAQQRRLSCGGEYLLLGLGEVDRWAALCAKVIAHIAGRRGRPSSYGDHATAKGDHRASRNRRRIARHAA